MQYGYHYPNAKLSMYRYSEVTEWLGNKERRDGGEMKLKVSQVPLE
jgi:hypothetical protein